MAKSSKWYSGGFILVTVAESRDSSYQHPRISVCKLYEGLAPEARSMSDDRLPSKDYHDNPTRNADTLIAFEFQQNAGRNFEPGSHSECEPWLKLGDVQTSGAYGGSLATTIRLEHWGVDSRDTLKRLADVDKALKAYREALRELGAAPSQCEATNLMLALKHAFKLPVLFVVYRGYGKASAATVDPDPKAATAVWLKNIDDRASRTEGAH